MAALRSSLSAKARGDLYERLCVDWLASLLAPYPAAKIRQTGARGDKGRDIAGYFPIVSDGARQARLVGQCKAVGAAIGPSVFRELEGAIVRETLPEMPALGLLFSTSGFSKGTLWASRASQQPVILVHLRPARWGAEDDLETDEPPQLISLLENPPALRLVGNQLIVRRQLGLNPVASIRERLDV